MTTADSTPEPLVGLDRPGLDELLGALVTRSFQIDQIYHALYLRGVTDFSEMTNLSLALRRELSENFSLGLPEVASRQASADRRRSSSSACATAPRSRPSTFRTLPGGRSASRARPGADSPAPSA